jgi:shikimate kinase
LEVAARHSVIATGGGVVAYDYTIPILKRLGYILFIDRDPEILSASGTSRYFAKSDNGKLISLDAINVTTHQGFNYSGIADITIKNDGDENEGLASLVSVIKALERGA